MKLNIQAVCDVGLHRKINQDMVLVGNEYFRDMAGSYFVEIEKNALPFFVAVSDGMGGHKAGEIASEIVMHKSLQFIVRLDSGMSGEKLQAILSGFYAGLHEELVKEGIKTPSNKGMGATLVGLLFYSGKMYLINIGDSRCYRLRGGILRQLSKDHSLAEYSGIQRKQSHILLNSIGGGDSVFVEFKEVTELLSTGDYVILCSDGLTDMLPDEVMESFLQKNMGTDTLLEEAKRAGGKDNISIVMIEITS